MAKTLSLGQGQLSDIRSLSPPLSCNQPMNDNRFVPGTLVP